MRRIEDRAGVSTHHETQSRPLDPGGCCLEDNPTERNTDAAARRAGCCRSVNLSRSIHQVKRDCRFPIERRTRLLPGPQL